MQDWGLACWTIIDPVARPCWNTATRSVPIATAWLQRKQLETRATIARVLEALASKQQLLSDIMRWRNKLLASRVQCARWIAETLGGLVKPQADSLTGGAGERSRAADEWNFDRFVERYSKSTR